MTSSRSLPANVVMGANSVLEGDSFGRFRSELKPGLVIGDHCTMNGVHFAVGIHGRVEMGDYCYFTDSILLCEEQIQLGSYVIIGWNATITDCDFHPIAPAERIQDAIACSPLGANTARPSLGTLPVIIEDDVWIGPCAVILKGARIGAGSIIDPGAVVTRNVPPRSRATGNPATIVPLGDDD